MQQYAEVSQGSEIADSVGELIGETPLLRLDGFAPNLLAKVEALNPYSVKDRIARRILNVAEDANELKPGGLVVEATSGNTGIGLAALSAARGYECVLVMPDSMSTERRALLRGLGATLELTPAADGMAGAQRRARELADQQTNAILARQFANQANPAAHRETTGPELWRATDGGIDALVAGVGTGGTITGVSEYIKEDRGKDTFTAVAVEPAESPTITEQSTASHDIQGIGPGFLPRVLRTELIDSVQSVTADEARAATRALGRTEGLLVGISAGAAFAVAQEFADDHPDKLTVVVLPDTGERYLSTDLFDET